MAYAHTSRPRCDLTIALEIRFGSSDRLHAVPEIPTDANECSEEGNIPRFDAGPDNP